MSATAKRVPKIDTATIFRQILRKHRLRQGLSQEALAAKAGYERAFISLVELGKCNPSLRSVFDICSTLGMRSSAMIRQVERTSWMDTQHRIAKKTSLQGKTERLFLFGERGKRGALFR